MAIASKELRVKAVDAYKTGKFTQKQLADAYGVHYKTIQNWLKADARGEDQTPKPRGHRPRIFTESEEKELILILNDNPSITLEDIKLKFNKTCSISVIHRTLQRLGFTYKKISSCVGTRSRRCKKVHDEWAR